MDKKELEKTITDLIDNPSHYDYKKHAFEELEAMEKQAGKDFPNIAFILNDYPDFNSIGIKVTQPGHFVFKLYLNPDDYRDLPIKKKKKAIKKLVKMYANYARNGRAE